MKKNIIIGLLFLILVVLVAQSKNIARAAGQYWRHGSNASQMWTSNSTTSPAWLAVGAAGAATTTNTFTTGDCLAVTAVVQFNASSTNANSWVQIDRSASMNGVDFYNYDTSLVYQVIRTGEKTLASSTQPITWKPSILGATTTKTFSLDLIPSLYTKIAISLASTTGGGIYQDRANVWVDYGCSSQLY